MLNDEYMENRGKYEGTPRDGEEFRQYSIIGRLGLNHRVRDGNGCVP